MKLQKYTYNVLALIVFFTLTNCQDLNYDETTGNTKEDIFNDIARSKSFLSGIYSYLPTDYNSIDGAMRAAATDEAEHVTDISDVQKFNDGSWSGVQQLDNVWNNMFNGIRAANVFLKESAGQTFPDQQYTATYENLIKQFNNYPYEARFLRAFFYFELVKRYKKVPIIKTVLTAEESANVEQASFEEVVDFIVTECDAVAAVLPLSYSIFAGDNETGRATKGAALALKARILLYAASPLHNTSGDVVLWQKAANAAKAVMDLGIYTLPASYNSNFNMLVATPTSELIMERRVAASNDFEKRNFPIGYEGGNTGTCPTQNLVDCYEMAANGKAITDPTSRYNPLVPYNGRDARLDQTVIRNSSSWKGSTIEPYINGKNGFPLPNATKTGYYLKKYLIQDINLDTKLGSVTTREHNWILFRYAEVLLNYAEAMNEAYATPQTPPVGGGKTALEAVNEVRRRANGARFVFPNGMTKEAFREKLRNERRVELAFEDHRFWDIRRWKIGEQTKDIYAMKIIYAPENTYGFIYEKVLLETRVFEERMNLYPIPQSEIFKSNGKLKQNPGWE
jgi:hypothetical protein